MKMAKASEADLQMAMELCGMLDGIGHRHCPSMPAVIARNDGDEDFDRDDDEQCGRVLRVLLETAERGSLSRVVWGAVVMLDPRNNLVDPDADTIERHPDYELRAALAQNAEPDDDFDAIVACLGDDAATLREQNPECEIAANMEAAERMLVSMRAALAEQAPARVPLTEQQIVACITEADCHGGAMRMSYGSGPYEITRPTLNALAIVRAIERAHGIGAAP